MMMFKFLISSFKFQCRYCPESFISKQFLTRHQKYHGKSLESFTCSYCNKVLATASNRKAHIQRHHLMTHTCEICKAALPSRELLKDHIDSCHEPFSCDVCGKSYRFSRYLKIHQKQVHYNSESHRLACPYCPKDFAKQRLKGHVFARHRSEFDVWFATQVYLLG